MTKRGIKANRVIFRVVIYLVLTVLAFLFVFPIFNLVAMSLTAPGEMSLSPQPLLPAKPMWHNYVEVFDFHGKYKGTSYFLIYLKNSLLMVLLNVSGTIITATFAAYAFSKINFKYKNIFFAAVLSTMMIPSAVTIIPMYTIYNQLKMINTQYPLWIGAWFGGGAVNIFLLIQFMRGIPGELIESAEIDGAGHVRTLIQIMVPNCIPIIIYIVMQTTLGVWNDFFTPLLYITSKQHLNTLALGITNIMQTLTHGVTLTKNLLMASCVIMTVLPLAVFIAGQKYFMEGIAFSGLKG